MRASRSLLYYRGGPYQSTPPLVQIEHATFYRHHPATVKVGNPPLFQNLSFNLSCDVINRKRTAVWAIVGPSNSGKTTLLEILRGGHLCVPPTARSFPHLGTIGQRPDVRLLDKRDLRLRSPVKAIQYVGFGGKGDKLGQNDTQGAYLAARYESRREATDFSLEDYLKGYTDLNPADEQLNEYQKGRDKTTFQRAVKLMKLHDLLDLPVSRLSNGQTRRARIAKALMGRPRLMLLDEPFLGIDPLSQLTMSPLLYSMSRRSGPQIILALQPTDEIPRWITHLIYLEGTCSVKYIGEKEEVFAAAAESGDQIYIGEQYPGKWRKNQVASKEQQDAETTMDDEDQTSSTGKMNTARQSPVPRDSLRWDMNYDTSGAPDDDAQKEPLVEMNGVKVSYGDQTVLGNWQQDVQGQPKDGLWWNVNRGERWAIFGPNGSGKTTILSLICSDHPQSYSLPIRYWGRPRLPTANQLGISVFDIQAHIGQSSPEIHGFFPRQLTVRQAIENSWADTFLSKPRLTHENDKVVDALLRWFANELNPRSQGVDLVDSLTFTLSDHDRPKAWSIPSKQLDHYRSSEVDWADRTIFRDLSFSSQRVVLLLRAIAKRPDLVILDEAFSGMDERTRIKCMMFLAYGESKWLRPDSDREVKKRPKTGTIIEKRKMITFGGFESRQALLCVSHRKEEVPGLITQWMCLPEPNTGQTVRFGEITYDMRRRQPPTPAKDWWETVWGAQLDTALKNPERRTYYYDRKYSREAV